MTVNVVPPGEKEEVNSAPSNLRGGERAEQEARKAKDGGKGENPSPAISPK